MNYWNKIPLFRLLLPLISGIILSIYFSFTKEYIFWLLVILFISIGLISSFKSKFSSYYNRWYFGAFVNLFLFFFGIYITESKKPENIDNHYTLYSGEYYQCELIEDIVPKRNSFKCEVEVNRVKLDEEYIKTKGKAILYLAKDSLSKTLAYGDNILVKGEWKIIDPPTNPAQFNYKNYLYNSGILAQQYVTPNNWNILNETKKASIRKYAFIYQKKLLRILESNFVDDELSVVSALLIGYKDLLDREIIMTYASSGAMHVLAVSGLHVGIIFLILNSLLFFLDRIKYGKYFKAILLIIALWIYALITGLSPSVLRASTMFSFIIIGRALKRDTNIYNTLAASAFLLLIYNPFILLQVGFQLSYSAVLGIVYLQPKLYKLFHSSNWLIDKIWAISTVSIAAQIATFPFGMYYFHQFPNYFLLSNLFVIPLATIIIGLGIMLFSLSWITPISNIIALILNKLLLFLNYSVDWVQSLPHSLSLGISISKIETILIYLIILLIIPSLIKKNFRLIKVVLSLSIFLVFYQVYEKTTYQNQKYFIVYDVKSERAIDFVDGNKNYFIANESLAFDKSKMRFHIMHYRWERRVMESTLVPQIFNNSNYYKNDNFIQFYDKKILLWDNNFIPPTNLNEIQWDYIIASNKASVNLENINCKLLVIDSSVGYYKKEEIKKECQKWNIPFYDVNENGAFIASQTDLNDE